MIALLALAGIPMNSEAAEVGAHALVYSWPDGINNFNTYTKASGGAPSPAAAGNGWTSYASGGFHGLAASGNATTPGTGSFGRGYVGGNAYWFEQITISSPTVPAGTIGVANFTLFFKGHVSAESQRSDRENKSSIGYRWVADGDGANNMADLNVGEYTQRIVYGSLNYADSSGPEFLDQPRHHQVIFRFGQPFDFTVAVHCQAEAWRDAPGKVRAELRCTGWNGLRDVQVRNGAAAPDATITSQTGFNYANAGSASYGQWARLYQLDGASMQADSNGNRLSNLMEYALGRNPLEPDSSPPGTLGSVNIGGSDYQTYTFTRPRLGARAGDIVYLPQRGDMMNAWDDVGLETTVAPSTTDTETVTVRSTLPMVNQTSEFLRLQVTGP